MINLTLAASWLQIIFLFFQLLIVFPILVLIILSSKMFQKLECKWPPYLAYGCGLCPSVTIIPVNLSQDNFLSDLTELKLVCSQQCKELSPLRMSVTDLLCLSFTSEQVLRYCAAQYQVRQGSWIKLTGSLTGGKKKHLDASCHQQKKRKS